MNSHRRQSSNGSFSLDQTHFQASFSSLDNFMFVSKLMQDEIMVPSKLKDKHFEKITSIPENEDISKVELPCTDVLDHYRFISMLRNQFMQPNPFTSLDEDSSKELKSKQFKKTFENLCYHYTELMSSLDRLSLEAKSITDIYKDNVK